MNNDPAHQSLNSGEQDLLLEALAEYHAAVDAGTVDIAALRSKYSTIASQLDQCIGTLDSLRSLGVVSDSRCDSDTYFPPTDLGEFTLLREIGKGGMGVVYEAEQRTLRRRVAVKILPLAGLLDRRQLERFRNEARAAAMLKHPNIVSVLSVGHDQGVHYYAMELIDGCSLADVIRDMGSKPSHQQYRNEEPALAAFRETNAGAVLSTARVSNRRSFFRNVAQIGIQTAKALQAAHDASVVHRDIKPSNLLLDQDGQLLVADFGLARIQTDQGVTMTGDIVGTLRYMSPEQIENDRIVDHRTDIYSLGATLQELVSASPAFTSTNRALLLSDIVSGNANDIRIHAADIPRDLETIITKALATSVDARYQTCREMEADLQRFLDGKPILARRASSMEVFARWCIRNRSKAAFLGLTTLILLAAAIAGPVAAVNQAARARNQEAISVRQRHEAYDSDMARAHEHINHGEIDQGVELLRKYLPEIDGGPDDYRSFEWYEMVYRCRRRLEAKEIRLGIPVWGLAVSPNGDIAAAPLFDGPVIYDAKTRERQWPSNDAPERSPGINDLAFSPDGRFLLSVGEDCTLRIWSTEQQKQVVKQAFQEKAVSVAVTRGGLIAVGTSASGAFPGGELTPIYLFELNEDQSGLPNLKQLSSLVGAVGTAREVSFSPNGRHLACGSEDNTLRIWNAETFTLEKEFKLSGPVMATRFSPEGKFIVGAGGIFERKWRSGEAVVFDLEEGATVATFYPETLATGLTFLSEDQFATAHSDGVITVWDIPRKLKVDQISAHSDLIRHLEATPGTDRLVSGGEDNTIRIWNLETKDPPSRLTLANWHNVMDVSFTKDGSELVTATGDGAIRIWDTNDSSLIKTLGHHGFEACSVDCSPDGQSIASIAAPWPSDSPTSELKIWDAETNVVETHLLEFGYARSVAFAPSGKHLAISGGENLVLWNIAEQKIEQTAVIGGGFHVVFSRDGSLIGTVGCLLKYPTLELIRDFRRDREVGPFAVDIHPNNKLVAFVDQRDIVVLSTTDGTEVQRLAGHNSVILHFHFSPDGKRLASASQSGLVIIWNIETGQELLRYRDHKFWAWTGKFLNDGRLFASSQGGRFLVPTVKLRRTVTPIEARRLLQFP